jgi:hypothetical protein
MAMDNDRDNAIVAAHAQAKKLNQTHFVTREGKKWNTGTEQPAENTYHVRVHPSGNVEHCYGGETGAEGDSVQGARDRLSGKEVREENEPGYDPEARLAFIKQQDQAAKDFHERKKKKARDKRRERDSIYADLGMKKVRGNLGGTYYESIPGKLKGDAVVGVHTLGESRIRFRGDNADAVIRVKCGREVDSFVEVRQHKMDALRLALQEAGKELIVRELQPEEKEEGRPTFQGSKPEGPIDSDEVDGEEEEQEAESLAV